MPNDNFVRKGFTKEHDLEAERKESLLEEMGLNRHEVDKLKRMMLGSKEAVVAKREELDKIRRHKGLRKGWEEFVDEKRRLGRVLHHTEIIRGLRSIVPSLIVCRGGQIGRISMYAIRNTPIYEIEGYPLATKTKRVDCPIYIGWLDLGISPEYEIDKVNEVDVAIGQRRGWRTLLLRLMLRRAPHCKQCADKDRQFRPHPNAFGRPLSFISERQAFAAFGNPTNGATASNYRAQLWMFRNGYI